MLRLLNRYEEIVFDQISTVGRKYGLSVYPKVRVADVVDLDALQIDYSHKSFGLRAHFDFLIARDYRPLYAIEFDGPSHAAAVQQERDKKKDRLCKLEGLPILRINGRHLAEDYGTLTLIAWIMETYEMQCGFHEAQEIGQIPADEIFDPFSLMEFEEGKITHPLWLSRSHRLEMRRLHKQGRLQDFASSGLIGENFAGTMRGFEYIRVNATHGLSVETAMRPQQFPILFSDLLGEILVIQLMSRISAYLAGEASLEPLSCIYDRIELIQAQYRMRCSHFLSSPALA